MTWIFQYFDRHICVDLGPATSVHILGTPARTTDTSGPGGIPEPAFSDGNSVGIPCLPYHGITTTQFLDEPLPCAKRELQGTRRERTWHVLFVASTSPFLPHCHVPLSFSVGGAGAALERCQVNCEPPPAARRRKIEQVIIEGEVVAQGLEGSL